MNRKLLNVLVVLELFGFIALGILLAIISTQIVDRLSK